MSCHDFATWKKDGGGAGEGSDWKGENNKKIKIAFFFLFVSSPKTWRKIFAANELFLKTLVIAAGNINFTIPNEQASFMNRFKILMYFHLQ